MPIALTTSTCSAISSWRPPSRLPWKKTRPEPTAIWFPEGIWFDFFTGEKFAGPAWQVQTKALD
jgi:hypothetical protein